MACSEAIANKSFCIEELNHFPPLENGRLNVIQFLKASSDLLIIVDSLGKILIPVKRDMQGNIDKIKSSYNFDETSCLFELILNEISEGKNIGADATLWLNRALLFFELTFQEILNLLKENDQEINMPTIITRAYEGSVKKYHNWAIQKLFKVTCRLSPSFSQIMQSLGLENKDSFESQMSQFTNSIHVVRTAIDNFFVENSLFCESN